MPIYSNNRTGSMALAQVAANESYTSEDFGRILYESQLNDMAFFEAVLACDFKEINGLREGTILEAEVKKLNKVSLKDLGKDLIDRLKRLWEKLKGVFNSAKQKFAAWVLKDGKALVAEFKNVNYSSWNGKVEGVATFNYNDECLNVQKIDWIKEVKNAINDENINATSIVNSELGKLIGSDSVSMKEYTAKAMEICKKEVDLDNSNIKEFISNVDKADVHIKFLNNYQKMAEGRINMAIKNINTETEGENASASRLNAIVHAYEMLLATMTKTAIAVTKADMKSRAGALRKALFSIKANGVKSKFVKEAVDIAVQCEYDNFNEAMTGSLNMDAETRTAVMALIAAC